MKDYLVTMEVRGNINFTVQAKDENEAYEKAHDEMLESIGYLSYEDVIDYSVEEMD